MTLPQNLHDINKYGVSTKVPFRSRFAGRRHKSLILILLFLFCFAVLGWLGYKNMSNGTFWHSKTDIASNNDELGDSKTSRIPPSSSTSSSSSSQPISIQAATASSTLFMTNSSNGCCSYSEVVQLVVKSIKRKSTYRVMEVDFIVDDSSRMETIVVKLSAAASDVKSMQGRDRL